MGHCALAGAYLRRRKLKMYTAGFAEIDAMPTWPVKATAASFLSFSLYIVRHNPSV
jgi:hypothetical protein